MNWMINLSPTGGKVPEGIRIKPQQCKCCGGRMVIRTFNNTELWICDDCTNMEEINYTSLLNN